jgi:hypothetical protein
MTQRAVARLTILLALASASGPILAADDCPPNGYSLQRLQQLKSDEFRIADATERQQLASDLLACLGDPRPELRDGIAFEAMSTWMRRDEVDVAHLRQLRDALLPMLHGNDLQGFRAPFAALVLSEVARTDRIKPWLSKDERDTLVRAAADFLSGVRDYRGFNDREGWRHGVAHGSDFVLQLALNPAVDKPQLDRLLAAVASQVSPAETTFYHFGEPERLAQPVLYIAKRGIYSEAEWKLWFEKILTPAPMASWNEAFSSEAGLAKRHNSATFLLALYASASESEDSGMRALLPALREGFKRVP